MINSDKERLLSIAAWCKIMDGEEITGPDMIRILTVLEQPGVNLYSPTQDEVVGLQQRLSQFLNQWQQALSQNNPQ